MIINRYGLLYSLFSIINHKEQSDAEYVIAEYLLRNYNNIGTLNIYKVSESCNVSRSTVRRFCESIGFENFATMKKEFDKYDDEHNRYISFYHRENFSEYLTLEVNRMATELKQVPEVILEEISKKIHDSSKVVFLTSSVGAAAVGQFQQGMLFANKVIHVVSDHFDNHPLLNSLEEDDLLIVLSGSANLARSLIPQLKMLKPQILLMTMNESVSKVPEYHSIYNIKDVLPDFDSSILYFKYGFMFFLDMLLSKYINDYKKENFRLEKNTSWY